MRPIIFASRRVRILPAAIGCSLAVGLAGCTSGPNFAPPTAPRVNTYLHGKTPAVISPGKNEPEQRLASGRAITGQWWGLYRSKRLDEVLQQALQHSPDLAAARETLVAAREAVIQARGGYFPQVDVSGRASRDATGPGTNDLYSVGATIYYVPDLFGASRRAVEQQQALADYQYYQLAAAWLSLTGNVVTEAINIASTRQQIAALKEIIANDQQDLRLVNLKYEAGKVARVDVLSAESQLANDRTQLPPLQQQLSQARHALAVLVGRFPGEWSPPDFDLAEFTLPAQLPLQVPSVLVHQRPDILAAEARLHADSAAIGVTASQLYPNLTLSANFGSQSASMATLFQGGSNFWNLVGNLTAPLFHAGALQAQKRAAVATFRASAARYEQTVLAAFGQVADTLRALAHDGDLVAAQQQALDTSDQLVRLQRLSYAAGKSDLLQLLDAERRYQQARLGYARAQAQRFQDSTQLLLAMGGGWSAGPGVRE
jgi:NodT family efflux transporter outer membrane factor (OMF) lipoprotein